MRTTLLWAITQRVVVIPYRRFGTDIFSPKRRYGITTTCCVTPQKSAVFTWIHLVYQVIFISEQSDFWFGKCGGELNCLFLRHEGVHGK